MTALRVLHVIDNLFPGGTEKQCLALVRGLTQRGVQNAVFYFRPGPLLKEFEQLEITLQRLPGGSYLSWRFPRQLASISRAIRSWAPQVVQTYGFYSNLPGLLAALLARTPVRIASRRDLGEHLRPAQRSVQRWTWQLAHRIVVNSAVIREQLLTSEHVPAQKVVVIHNGLDLTHWLAAEQVAGNGNREVLIGMVAHFRGQKDHTTFLNAAKEIVRAVPRARFCLVGEGPLEAASKEYARQLGIADRVDFLGRMEGEALRNVVQHFSVSLLTSKNNEGLPNAVLEAMALGLPVVATTVGGTGDAVEHERTGFLVPPENPAAVAQRVIRLLQEPQLARAMGERGRQKVMQEFSMGRMVEQFYGLYHSLV